MSKVEKEITFTSSEEEVEEEFYYDDVDLAQFYK